jgi:large conductance mechanosensitive channel
MWKEFKEFAFKGNVLDLAVAVVIGAAFGKIVTAFVDYLIMPAVGMIMGGIKFTSLAVTIGSASIQYGQVIQAAVDFLIIAFFIFLVVKAANKIMPKKEEAPAGPSETELLTEIRDLLKDQQK